MQAASIAGFLDINGPEYNQIYAMEPEVDHISLTGADTDRRRASLLHDELRRQIRSYVTFSGKHAGVFSVFYYIFRPATLGLAIATTAASSLLSPKNSCITLLAGLVTLVAALDSWLKPQVKWKLHDETNDEFSLMLLRLASIGNEDLPALEGLGKELGEVVARYRNARLLE